MILLELAAQGIRGVAPASGRATFRPGYNVVAADGPTLRRLVEALLRPAPGDGESLPRAAGAPAGAPVRAGLTVVGDDRVTYRLVRDFAAGAQLQRFDAERRAFSVVSRDLAEIASYLAGPVGAPPAERLDALLSLSAGELPSKAPGVAPAAVAARAPLTGEQAERRIAQLEAERERARVAERLQREQDGLEAELLRQDEALKVGATLREAIARAEGARAELEPVARIAAGLGDVGARLAAFEKASARREEAAARMAAEREVLAAAEATPAAPPFWRDPRFWVGAGGGAGLALAGALGAAVHPDLRYVALLDVPAFGWAAWVALGWIGSLERSERAARRRRVVDDWEAKVEAQYARDAAEVREAMATLGVSGTAELKEALLRLGEAEAALGDARARLAEWETSPEARRALAERTRLEGALREVEGRLGEVAGGFVRDVRSIEAELHRVRAEASAPPPAPTPVPAAGASRGGTEPARPLAQRAGAALGVSPATAVRAVSARASQALSGLSLQRLQALQADDRGNLQIQAGGRVVADASLPPADRDLVFLALKLALLEQALGAGRRVALVEDAFAGVSDGARRFAARFLKQIARSGQVVHATADVAFREAADHSA